MRISWLEEDVIRLAQQILADGQEHVENYFTPGFTAPASPKEGWEEWPQVVEHVARCERVSATIRAHGLEYALAEYGDSEHAVEIAVLISAASQNDSVTVELVESVLSKDIDELVAYGAFLSMLVDKSSPGEHVVAVYESFVAALLQKRCQQPLWEDRVQAARDGLATVYVGNGRLDDGHQLFVVRHREQTSDVLVALAASRSFLSCGYTGRAVEWLGIGAERADSLGRVELAAKLRDKQVALRKRLS